MRSFRAPSSDGQNEALIRNICNQRLAGGAAFSLVAPASGPQTVAQWWIDPVGGSDSYATFLSSGTVNPSMLNTVAANDNFVVYQWPELPLTYIANTKSVNTDTYFGPIFQNVGFTANGAVPPYSTAIYGAPIFAECSLSQLSVTGVPGGAFVNCFIPSFATEGGNCYVCGGSLNAAEFGYGTAIWAPFGGDLTGDVLISGAVAANAGICSIYSAGDDMLITRVYLDGLLQIHGNGAAAHIDSTHDTTYANSGLIWGPGIIEPAFGGAVFLYNNGSTLDPTNYIQLSQMAIDSGATTASAYEPSTGLWFGNRSITPTAMKTAIASGGFMNAAGKMVVFGLAGKYMVQA